MLASLVTPLLLLAPDLLRVGTYKVTYIKPGEKKPTEYPANTPPGARPIVAIEGDRWIMRDMMVGFNGTFKVSGRVVTFTATEGPSGKLKRPVRLVFELSPDGRTLTQRQRSPKDIRLVWTWVEAKLVVRPPQ